MQFPISFLSNNHARGKYFFFFKKLVSYMYLCTMKKDYTSSQTSNNGMPYKWYKSRPSVKRTGGVELQMRLTGTGISACPFKSDKSPNQRILPLQSSLTHRESESHLQPGAQGRLLIRRQSHVSDPSAPGCRFSATFACWRQWTLQGLQSTYA